VSAGTFWLASYPKSGNTWFRAFLANLLNEADQPVSINELHTGQIASARGWIDDVLGFDTADLSPQEILRLRPVAYDWLFRDATQYAYHKIHDAYIEQDGRPLFAGGDIQGAIYFVRNPLDVAISYAHHCGVSIDQAIAFMGDANHCMAKSDRRLVEQLAQPLLTWSQHVESWVDNRDVPVLVLRYEDMHSVGHDTFARAAQFLRQPHDAARIDKAMRQSSFEELKQQELREGFRERSQKAQSFFRNGKVGDWYERLSRQQIEKIIADHFDVMRRFDYVDGNGEPVLPPDLQ
jgi:hypothetical protein